MMMRPVLALILGIGLAGCEKSSPASDAESQRQTPALHPIGADELALMGRVSEFRYGSAPRIVLGGVRICIDVPQRCTESFDDGFWKLAELESEREVTLSYEKEGYLTLYQRLVTPSFSTQLRVARLTPDEGHRAPYEAALESAGKPELPPDDGLGSIVFSAVFPDAIYLNRSVHVRIEPEVETQPFYVMSDTGEIVTELPANKRVATWATFLNVPPGEDYELEFTLDDGECVFYENDLGGWPAKDGRKNVERVAAYADAITWIRPRCARQTPPSARRSDASSR